MCVHMWRCITSSFQYNKLVQMYSNILDRRMDINATSVVSEFETIGRCLKMDRGWWKRRSNLLPLYDVTCATPSSPPTTRFPFDFSETYSYFILGNCYDCHGYGFRSGNLIPSLFICNVRLRRIS